MANNFLGKKTLPRFKVYKSQYMYNFDYNDNNFCNSLQKYLLKYKLPDSIFYYSC